MNLNWRKSSYSAEGGGNCVEVAWTWRKSSYSGNGGSECVEVAWDEQVTAVRDSKNPTGATPLVFPQAAWRRFVTGRQNWFG